MHGVESLLQIWASVPTRHLAATQNRDPSCAAVRFSGLAWLGAPCKASKHTSNLQDIGRAFQLHAVAATRVQAHPPLPPLSLTAHAGSNAQAAQPRAARSSSALLTVKAPPSSRFRSLTCSRKAVPVRSRALDMIRGWFLSHRIPAVDSASGLPCTNRNKMCFTVPYGSSAIKNVP